MEAGVYNDLTRRDITAVFTEKGDDQKSAADELKQHSKLLQSRIARARELAVEPASRSMLDYEKQLSERYAQAGDALVDAMVHRPSDAPALLGPYVQLYTELRGKMRRPAINWSRAPKTLSLRRKKRPPVRPTVCS